MNDILTKKEVSQFLKCSIGMVDKLMSNNLPYYKIGRNVKFKKEEIVNKGEEWQRKFAKEIGLFLEKEEVAFDIVNHRSAPPGLRIWTGATVESSDVEKLLPWIDWAYKQALTNIDSN